MSRVARVVLLIMLAVASVGAKRSEPSRAGALELPASRPTEKVERSAVAEALMGRVNELRREQGRDALAVQPQLAQAAHQFAEFMADHHIFSHEADRRTPGERARAYGYRYCVLTENIAFEQRSRGFSSDELARLLFEEWKNSPPHRRNMLDPGVIETGFGLARSAGNDRWYAVQMFGSPESARMVFEISNQATRAVRYRLGDQEFELAPRYTRTHEECQARELVLEGDGGGTTIAARPKAGARYRILQDTSGTWRLEQE